MASRYGLQIRAATGSDAPGIAELMASAGHPIAASTLEARIDAVRQVPGAALLALEWGPPSGILVLTWFRTLEADGPVAQVTTLLVGPDDRRRGIGRMLLKAGSQAARQAGCATLHLAVPPIDDGSLRAFCDATGFGRSGTLHTRPLRKRGEGG